MKSIHLLLFVLVLNAPVLAQPATTDPPTNVAILVYPGVELLDFAGPLDVFSSMKNSRVYTVAGKPAPLHTMKKSLTITPDYALTDCPPPETDDAQSAGDGANPVCGGWQVADHDRDVRGETIRLLQRDLQKPFRARSDQIRSQVSLLVLGKLHPVAQYQNQRNYSSLVMNILGLGASMPSVTNCRAMCSSM